MFYRGIMTIEVLISLVLIALFMTVGFKASALSDALWVKGSTVQAVSGLNYARSAAESKQEIMDVGGDSTGNKWLGSSSTQKKVGFTEFGTTRFANTLHFKKGRSASKVTVGVGLGKVSP